MLKTLLPYLAPLLVIGMVLWRSTKAMKGRPVKPSRLWIRPVIIAVLMAVPLATSPAPGLLGLVLWIGTVLAGAGLGYLMARHQHFTLDPATGAITSRMSPVGTALFLGLFAARYAFRLATTGGQVPDKLTAHSGQIMVYTDAGLLFVLAMVSAQAWETWRRTKPLLDEHAARNGKDTAQSGQA